MLSGTDLLNYNKELKKLKILCKYCKVRKVSNILLDLKIKDFLTEILNNVVC